MAGRLAFDNVRSILESPILDDHKWAKVPAIATDAVLLDLEDSVAVARKQEARARVCEYLGRPEFFGAKVPIPRVNALDTPWGHDDVRALAECKVARLAYPKVRSADELMELRRLLQRDGADPDLVVIVETARAVLELEHIARVPGVVALVLGPSDLSVDVGCSLFSDGRFFADAYHYPKSKLALVGAAYEIPVYDTVFVPDLRDAEQVRAAAQHARQLGFAGMATFYPPHVEVVNRVFSPSEEELAAARETIAVYEKAVGTGAAAVQVSGRALIIQDYKRAKRIVDRARR